MSGPASPPSSKIHCPRKKRWAHWLHENIVKQGLLVRELASRVNVDTSYVTLMVRDGYIPKREIVERIGNVFGNPDEALVYAGLIPDKMHKDVLRLIKDKNRISLDAKFVSATAREIEKALSRLREVIAS